MQTQVETADSALPGTKHERGNITDAVNESIMNSTKVVMSECSETRRKNCANSMKESP